MTDFYKSPYEAYPFLCDDAQDLRCDFEILTDYIASQTGLLQNLVTDTVLKAELLKVCELIYHFNPTLRTFLSVTPEEIAWLLEIASRLKEETSHRCKLFVLPQGGLAGGTAHLLRTHCKSLVRLLYRYHQQGNFVSNESFDIANLLSGYFFYLALKLNELDGIDEIPYTSRNYK